MMCRLIMFRQLICDLRRRVDVLLPLIIINSIKQHRVCTRVEMKSSEFKSLCSHKYGNKKMNKGIFTETLEPEALSYTVLADGKGSLVWAQQIECPFFSCPLDYRIDTDHRNLQPVAQPQALPYFRILSSCLAPSCSVTRAEICMKMG